VSGNLGLSVYLLILWVPLGIFVVETRTQKNNILQEKTLRHYRLRDLG